MSDPHNGTSRLVRFGVFELDLRSGDLRKAGARLNLPEQPLRVLTALLERPGELVTRDELRQRLWPSDTFVDFEHGLNAAVKRLRDVLGDSVNSPRFVETVPTRGYRFVAPVNADSAKPSESVTTLAAGSAALHPQESESSLSFSRDRSRGRWIAVGAATTIGISALTVFLFRGQPPDANTLATMHVVPLPLPIVCATSASFSPDGNKVAFAGCSSIYVTEVGSGTMTRITADHTADSKRDFAPSWSPDGRFIAFNRIEGSTARVYLTPPNGEGEVMVSDLGVAGKVSWSTDGRFLVAAAYGRGWDPSAGIYLIPVLGGQPRRIVSTTMGQTVHSPVLSPDGRRFAYVSCESGCGLYVMALTPDLSPSGSPQRLPASAEFGIGSVTWSHDGRSVVYDAEGSILPSYLWRIPTDGTGGPQRIDIVGAGSSEPAASGTRDRLVFTRTTFDTDVYRFEPGRDPQPVLISKRPDFDQAFSPDGADIVFASGRLGEGGQIWRARADGLDAHPLLFGPGRIQGSPHWSPDGKRIAFDSIDETGNWHIWVIDASGGAPRRLTTTLGDQICPTWSEDGNNVYYSATTNGQRDIWRMSVKSGAAQRITLTGSGAIAYEWKQGGYLVYQAGDGWSPLELLTLETGSVRELAPCATERGFGVAPKAIYYVDCEPHVAGYSIHVVDPGTTPDRILGALPGFAALPIGVSPDGGAILYPRTSGEATSLMLIENFK